MNKKIKIIELLNKIANGEKVPRKIKYNAIEFTKSCEGLYSENNDGLNRFADYINCNFSNINDEVEILEDNTEEIEELDEIHTTLFNNLPEDVKINYLRGFIQEDRKIINELVRAVNQIRKEIKQ